MTLRNYDIERDKEAIHRIWKEVGWLEKDQEANMDLYASAGRALVAEVHGEAECLVITAPATMQYLEEDLALCAVTGVTTSRVARKQGLAGRLAAKAIAQDAQEGALVAGLGMFEQGYYNQLGFGTGGYEHHISFDPAHLVLPVKARIPRRLTENDGEVMHQLRLKRLRGHGACNLIPSVLTIADLKLTENGFGLGYFDTPDGELSHYFWGTAKGEHGPYGISWMVFQTHAQFLELMALIKNLGDQVRLIGLHEPPGVQVQDLLRQPFRNRAVTKKSEFEAGVWSAAYWQMRINDLPGCLEKTHLEGKSVHFQLQLSDPIERLLDSDEAWRGTSGDYIVTLGQESSAKRGTDETLPILTATVNAFTRMWLGVRTATGLSVTDDLKGSPELLAQLDRALRLPQPKPDWDF